MTTGGVELVVAEDTEGAAREAAALLTAAAARGAELVLTGGSTPRRAYELAAELEPDWHGAGVWWSDERCVPPEDDRSNFRLARESLLERLGRPPRKVHRIEGERGAETAAAAYEAELGGVQLDFVLLGIGPDGHTASLFPNAPALSSTRLAVAAEAHLEPFVDRVTLTIGALSASPEVVFLATGSEKAEAVGRAFGAPPDPTTPASLVRSRNGTTRAVLDAAAAAGLRR